MIQSIPVGAPSRFVNALAWVLMAVAAVSVVAMLWAQVPLATWVLLAASALTLATFGGALGLLLRLNWARKALMALLMVWAAVWAAVWLLALPVDGPWAWLASALLPAHWGEGWRWGAASLAVCVAALLVWAVGRLRSAGIRREFL